MSEPSLNRIQNLIQIALRRIMSCASLLKKAEN